MSKRPSYDNNSVEPAAGDSKEEPQKKKVKKEGKVPQRDHKKKKSTGVGAGKSEGKSMAAGNERFTFFWRSESPFSQFHSAEFTVDGIKYNCAEQYMMHQKAVLFDDEATGKKILASHSPIQMKSLGRKVTPFDPAVWSSKCQDIVAKGNYHKFTQNEHLLTQLLATEGTTLVEASPRDRIWGIGLGAQNPLA